MRVERIEAPTDHGPDGGLGKSYRKSASAPAPAATSISELSASELSRAIERKAVSSREVVGALLDQIESLNPRYNAIVSLRDRDRILAEADEKDRRLACGEREGWLHGLPIAIKDLFATQGLRTTRGSPIYRDFVPKADAGYVARLKQAGAIVIGKTNTAEFGLGSHTYNAIFGATRNAFDRSRTAGGSSGGAAVAVATRMLPIADGSDNAGSLRNPAAFNHIYAFRPSEGLVPAEGRNACAPCLSVIGPMARNVDDLCALLATFVGEGVSTPGFPGRRGGDFLAPLDRNFRGARIGWLGDFDGYLAIESEAMELCETALRTFASIGCAVEPASLNFPMEALWSAYCDLRSWLMGAALTKHYRDPDKRALLKPEAVWEIERGLALSAIQVFQAQELRARWRDALCECFKRFDFLALPAAQCLPFAVEIDWPREIAGRRMDSYHRWMEITIPATMGACPVANIPAGFSQQGLPTGLQLIAAPQNDFTCLQLAKAYERAAVFVDGRSRLGLRAPL